MERFASLEIKLREAETSLNIALRALREIARYGDDNEAQDAANALAEIDHLQNKHWPVIGSEVSVNGRRGTVTKVDMSLHLPVRVLHPDGFESSYFLNSCAPLNKKWLGWKCPSSVCDWQDRSSYSERFDGDPCPRCKTPIVAI